MADDFLWSDEDFNEEPQSEADLGRIAELVEEWRHAVADVESAEQRLKEAKEKLRQIETVDLPNALAELGLSKIETEDGLVLKAEPVVAGSIVKGKEDEAFAWLEENGFGDLIKANVQVGFTRGEREKAQRLVEWLEAKGVHASLKESVHPQTLKAFLRRADEEGLQLPENLFKVYRATVVKPKKSRRS